MVKLLLQRAGVKVIEVSVSVVWAAYCESEQ
jgi:hypothetical protein